ncbi:hypothetical protein LPJ53_004567 [Coemansia erecta]|uniref:Prospore membrane adapter protein SPO71 PH domain-containing protein n=1 Tax=Coemansia erecta TaxID=147472 RepID=A0A9W7XY77_9FUNG|nr:hypothetical protein LPJ53_004567 [Coemansia erecta]
MHSTGAVAVSLGASPATGRVRAAVHKQPFAAMDTRGGAAGRGSVYAMDKARAWEENGVSKAVRVFIGTSNTAWMQRHQRWWVRTAEKLDKTSTGRRRLRRSLGAAGSSGDLLAAVAGGREDAEGAYGSSGQAAGGWSSESADSLSDSGSESASSDELEGAGDLDLDVGAGVGVAGLMTPQSSGVAAGAGVGGPRAKSTVPMPALADSPTREQHGVPPTPATAPAERGLRGERRSADLRGERRSADLTRVAGETARRRSSLSAIRAFFHRGDRKPASGGETGETGEAREAASALRGRAASLSGPLVAAGAASAPTTPTPKASLLSPTTPKTSLLRRTVASRQHTRTVTWQRAEAPDAGPHGADAVLLAGRAAVRLETASAEALSTAYTEVTCRALRIGAHEWAEMWAELDAHGVRFYASAHSRARSRAAAHVQLAAARLSVFSALDVSLALAYAARSGRKARVAVFKLRTAAEGREWYARLAGLMGGAMPRGVAVGVPELGVKVHVALQGGEDAWAVRAAAVAALLADGVVGRRAAAWLAAERQGDARVAVAWRRGDRLAWMLPSGAVDPAAAAGAWRVHAGDARVAGPALAEASHSLELRTLAHYPDSVGGVGGGVGGVGGEGGEGAAAAAAAALDEPPGVEGFVLLRRSDASLRAFRPVLLAAHDGLLFVVSAPRAARHLDCAAPGGGGGGGSAGCERLYHPQALACARQMCQARFMLKLAAVWDIASVAADAAAGEADSAAAAAEAEGPSSAGARARLRRLVHARPSSRSSAAAHASSAACRLRLTTRAGAWVELWAESAQCALAWQQRLRGLRAYWAQRQLADVALRSRACVLNYALQGRERDLPAALDERAYAVSAVWHACVLLGCRAVVHAGMLYRKRRRHQGLRRVFCVLTRGHLVEFDYPHVMGQDDQMVARVKAQDALLARMAVGAGEGAQEDSAEAPARLLFARSRTLALRRCYVVSRRTDDLSTEDIMCEPWVMTDIGNYSGLRLADRLYADGVVSHDFIDDCVFTVWRPPASSSLSAPSTSLSPAVHPALSSPSSPSVSASASASASASPSPPRSSAESCASEAAEGVQAKEQVVRSAAAGLRRRLAVYKARTAVEMELWVAAVNQEIRRMVEDDAW